MEFDNEIQRGGGENQRLLAQITDLEYLLEARESELYMLRAKVLAIARLQSEQENCRLELDQLKQRLEEALQKLSAQSGIREYLEEELLQSVSSEKELMELRKASASMRSENEYLMQELKELAVCRGQADALMRKISLLGSRLELAEGEIGSGDGSGDLPADQ